MHSNSNLGQCVFPSPPFTVSGLQDRWFVRMGICYRYKLSIRDIELDQIPMVRKFSVTISSFRNPDSINFLNVPLIILNPLCKGITHTRLTSK